MICVSAACRILFLHFHSPYSQLTIINSGLVFGQGSHCHGTQTTVPATQGNPGDSRRHVHIKRLTYKNVVCTKCREEGSYIEIRALLIDIPCVQSAVGFEFLTTVMSVLHHITSEWCSDSETFKLTTHVCNKEHTLIQQQQACFA